MRSQHRRPSPTWARATALLCGAAALELFVERVLQADEGCDFDFLRG